MSKSSFLYLFLYKDEEMDSPTVERDKAQCRSGKMHTLENILNII